MLTDTHCHLDDERYEGKREQVIKKSLDELSFLITVGTHPREFSDILEFMDEYDEVYGSLGIHPHYSLKITPEEAEKTITDNLIRPPLTPPSQGEESEDKEGKIVAIGECGVDYYWSNQDLEGSTEYEVREAQRDLFITQIEMAKKRGLPLVVHCRDEREGWDAYVDAMDILKEHNAFRGVAHSFNGDKTIMKQFVELGFHLGISGIVTFDKTGRLPEAVKEAPLDKLLLETDAPYLTPVPHRGKLNEPRFTKFIAEKIAEIKDIHVDEVLEVTENNARKLFGI